MTVWQYFCKSKYCNSEINIIHISIQNQNLFKFWRFKLRKFNFAKIVINILLLLCFTFLGKPLKIKMLLLLWSVCLFFGTSSQNKGAPRIILSQPRMLPSSLLLRVKIITFCISKQFYSSVIFSIYTSSAGHLGKKW